MQRLLGRSGVRNRQSTSSGSHLELLPSQYSQPSGPSRTDLAKIAGKWEKDLVSLLWMSLETLLWMINRVLFILD
jgi:hypothetical protein